MGSLGTGITKTGIRNIQAGVDKLQFVLQKGMHVIAFITTMRYPLMSKEATMNPKSLRPLQETQ